MLPPVLFRSAHAGWGRVGYVTTSGFPFGWGEGLHRESMNFLHRGAERAVNGPVPLHQGFPLKGIGHDNQVPMGFRALGHAMVAALVDERHSLRLKVFKELLFK